MIKLLKSIVRVLWAGSSKSGSKSDLTNFSKVTTKEDYIRDLKVDMFFKEHIFAVTPCLSAAVPNEKRVLVLFYNIIYQILYCAGSRVLILFI